MERGSLADLLHKKALSWRIKLRLSINAAEGV